MLICVSSLVLFPATFPEAGRLFFQHGRNCTESRKMIYPKPDVAGHAALAICESLLLALNDRRILPEQEILGILQDAAAAHENASGTNADPVLHQEVANLIQHIINSGNSVRRI
jgi:hypothetical protein